MRWSASSSISTPRPGPAADGACRRASSHSTEAIVAAKRRWVARPWASARRSPARAAGAASRPGARRGRSPPGRRGRSRRRRGGSRRRAAPPGSPPTLESLIPVSWKAPVRAARSASSGVSTLSSPASGIEVDAASSAASLHRRHRLLDELDPQRLISARTASRSPGPRSRWRRPGSAPPARAPRARPGPGRRPRRPRASA